MDWAFLKGVLSGFKFSEMFTNTIHRLYSHPKGKNKIIGGLSEPIMIGRGCRQGCNLSPLFFSIFIAPLIQWIRINPNIHGIQVNKVQNKIALLADNVLIYLTKPSESLPELHKTLMEFSKISGYKLNSHKSQVLSFNYSPNLSDKECFKIDWSMDSIFYLGVKFQKMLKNWYILIMIH